MPATILVVDDSPYVAESIALALRDAGYAVLLAVDGLDALAVLATVAVDLVLSDVRMPVMDGPALADELRRRGGAPPIVLMSSLGPPLPLPLPPGVGFLPKPFGLDDLLAAVRRHLPVTTL